MTGSLTTESPEPLLVKHADALSRKNNKLAEEGDLKGALNQVVCLVVFLVFLALLWC